METLAINELPVIFNANDPGDTVSPEIIYKILNLQRTVRDSMKPDMHPDDFLEKVLMSFGIKTEVFGKELSRIPKEGAFIMIANHPFTLIDELVLAYQIRKIRPDFRVVAHPMLKKIELLSDLFFTNEAFSEDLFDEINIYLRLVKFHLANNEPLGIFPSIKKIHFNFENNVIHTWNAEMLKFISKYKIPVIPVNINIPPVLKHSIISQMNPLQKFIQSAMKHEKVNSVSIRIGYPINPNTMKRLVNKDELRNYLQAKIYALGNNLEVEMFFNSPLFKQKKRVHEIIAPAKPELIRAEVAQLKKTSILHETNSYTILTAYAHEIPNMIKEIGRLREITFRDIGEGTNKSCDLDLFDIYYTQIIIWDNKHEKIVGAYRIGNGKDILNRFGTKGFYIRSLFKFKPEFNSILSQSLELGRSFIVKEYQKQTIPLYLLWKGIFLYIKQNEGVRYLLGPVSISNNFSKFTKSLLVSLINSCYYDRELSLLVKPKKKFRISGKDYPNISAIITGQPIDLEAIDTIVNEIEPDKKMPVLLKKYLSMNARIAGFNIDPMFNNCLDGLIILDLQNLPEKIVKSFDKGDGE